MPRDSAEAIARARAIGTLPTLAEGLCWQAQAALAQHHLPAARDAVDEAIVLARALPRPYTESKSLYLSGLLHREQREYSTARARLQEAMAVLQRLGERLYAEHVERALAALPR